MSTENRNVNTTPTWEETKAVMRDKYYNAKGDAKDLYYDAQAKVNEDNTADSGLLERVKDTIVETYENLKEGTMEVLGLKETPVTEKIKDDAGDAYHNTKVRTRDAYYDTKAKADTDNTANSGTLERMKDSAAETYENAKESTKQALGIREKPVTEKMKDDALNAYYTAKAKANENNPADSATWEMMKDKAAQTYGNAKDGTKEMLGLKEKPVTEKIQDDISKGYDHMKEGITKAYDKTKEALGADNNAGNVSDSK